MTCPQPLSRLAAAAILAFGLNACGGGGSSGPPALSPLPPDPGMNRDPADPGADEPPGGSGRASPHATSVVSRTDLLQVSSIYADLNTGPVVDNVVCAARGSVFCTAETLGGTIDLSSVSGLAQAPVLANIEPRAGVDVVGRNDDPTARVFGAWLRDSGFGIRTDRWDAGLRGTADIRYAVAFGEYAETAVDGPFVFPNRTWRGHVVAVRPGGSFWESVMYGDAEIRFGNGLVIDPTEVEAGDRVGTMEVDFTDIFRLRDRRSVQAVSFRGVTVEVLSATSEGDDENPVQVLEVMFGGGVRQNRIHGGIFGGEGDWDEVAGVFEQNGMVGAFGGNAEGSASLNSLYGGRLVEAGSAGSLNVFCGPGECTLIVDSMKKTALLRIQDSAGEDFGIGHDVWTADGVGYNAWGGWGVYSAFTVAHGVEEGVTDGFEFVLPVSQGLGSGENPVDGSAVWEGSMAGAAYSGAGVGEAVRGDVRLVADMPVSQLDLEIGNIRSIAGSGSWSDITWTGVPMAQGSFRGDRGLEGRFYGPGQEEVGGVFDDGAIAGAFGAQR